MAEVLFRAAVRGREMLAGVGVGSAGLAAREDDRASDEAIAVMRELDLDLTRHRARRLTPALSGGVDLMLVMTEEHAERIRGLCGEDVPVVTLGDYAGRGECVEAPFPGEIVEYRQVAEQLGRLIHAAVRRLEAARVRRR